MPELLLMPSLYNDLREGHQQNTEELSAIYQALDWIRKRLKLLDPAVPPRYNLVSDSDYCVKLFATRSIRPVANKRIIARRTHTILNQV